MSELTEDRVRELAREEILAVMHEQAETARRDLDEALARFGRLPYRTPRTGGDGAPDRCRADRRTDQGTGEEEGAAGDRDQ